MDIEKIPDNELYNATRAWRKNSAACHQSWLASGPFKFLMAEPNLSIYDRIDELVAEIVRLRK